MVGMKTAGEPNPAEGGGDKCDMWVIEIEKEED